MMNEFFEKFQNVKEFKLEKSILVKIYLNEIQFNENKFSKYFYSKYYLKERNEEK